MPGRVGGLGISAGAGAVFRVEPAGLAGFDPARSEYAGAGRVETVQTDQGTG